MLCSGFKGRRPFWHLNPPARGVPSLLLLTFGFYGDEEVEQKEMGVANYTGITKYTRVAKYTGVANYTVMPNYTGVANYTGAG